MTENGHEGRCGLDEKMRYHEIHELRREYHRGGLREEEVGDEPLGLFEKWFADAEASRPGGWYEVNAVALATVDGEGRPSVRMVLVKEYSEEGFVFFTNSESQKGRELEANPHAAMVFYFGVLERQVRVRGRVGRVSCARAEAYFHERPRENQLGAVVSRQSRAMSREELDGAYEKAKAEYAGKEIPVPPWWAGYVLKAEEVEFWQGRPSRLHDRIVFRRRKEGGWEKERLSP